MQCSVKIELACKLIDAFRVYVIPQRIRRGCAAAPLIIDMTTSAMPLFCYRKHKAPFQKCFTHSDLLPPEFNWVNTLLGNVKNAITGIYHAIRGQHAPRYLAEPEYRFNRRYDLKAMLPRFLTVAARTPLMPYRF